MTREQLQAKIQVEIARRLAPFAGKLTSEAKQGIHDALVQVLRDLNRDRIIKSMTHVRCLVDLSTGQFYVTAEPKLATTRRRKAKVYKFPVPDAP